MLSFWTGERISELVRMRKEGFAASFIAGKLGCTRNAVIGRAHRMKLEPGPAGTNQYKRTGRPPKPRANGSHVLFRVQRFSKQQMVEAAPMPEIPMLNVPLIEATDGQCRFVTDVPGPDGLPTFCGLKTVGKTSWCCGHLALVAEPSIYSKKRAA